MKRALFGLLAVLSGCGTPAPAPDSGATVDDSGVVIDAGVDAGAPDGGDELVITLLDAGALRTADGGEGWRYELYKVHRPSTAPSYVQWFPPAADAGPTGVVVLTQPYDGVGWTDDPRDQKWAARAPGSYEDEDEPTYRPDAGLERITWGQVTSPDAIAASSALYGLHGLGVLAIYGRWYLGGSIENDIQDMVNGLLFLRGRADVDHSRIGIHGGSWGGFEAVYGTIYSPPDVRPKFVSALFPLTDFENEMLFLKYGLARFTNPTLRAQYATFFEPFTRRIRASAGGWPGEPGADYRRYDGAAVIARLDMPVLLPHEDWDTLVPYEQSTALALARPNVEPVWYLHTNPQPADWNTLPPSHGPLFGQYGVLPSATFSYAFLLSRAIPAPKPIAVPYWQSNFRTFLTATRARQQEGKNISWLATRLREIGNGRCVVYDFDTNTSRAGAAWVASEVNAVWGTSFTAANIEAALANGMPP